MNKKVMVVFRIIPRAIVKCPLVKEPKIKEKLEVAACLARQHSEKTSKRVDCI